MTLIQTDNAVTPRHNGGALVGLSGELVGIIALGVDGQVASSFAIGMDTAVPVARQLVERGWVSYPYMGVFFSSQRLAVAEIGGEFKPVVRPTSADDPVVERVTEDGPAGQAGIKPGDIIVSLDRQKIGTTDDVRCLLRRKFEVGQKIEVVVTRDGETETIQLVLGERPTSTSLSVKPSLPECEVTPDADAETGHRASEMPRSTVEIPTLPSDYTMPQLERWREEAEAALWHSRRQLELWRQEDKAVVWPVAGVWSSWIDEKQNRIFFAANTSYVAEQARAALAETGVPIDAVIFEVDSKQQLDDPPVQIDSPFGISISLEFQRTVTVGQSVLIEVVLTNVGDDVAAVEHGFPIHEDVLVFTSDGDEVWTKLRGPQIGVGAITRLEPGEQIRLKTLWEQRDLDGFALPSGCYLVRGSIRIVDALGGFRGVIELATEPYELVIQP